MIVVKWLLWNDCCEMIVRHLHLPINDPIIPPAFPGVKRVFELNILGVRMSGIFFLPNEFRNFTCHVKNRLETKSKSADLHWILYFDTVMQHPYARPIFCCELSIIVCIESWTLSNLKTSYNHKSSWIVQWYIILTCSVVRRPKFNKYCRRGFQNPASWSLG